MTESIAHKMKCLLSSELTAVVAVFSATESLLKALVFAVIVGFGKKIGEYLWSLIKDKEWELKKTDKEEKSFDKSVEKANR